MLEILDEFDFMGSTAGTLLDFLSNSSFISDILFNPDFLISWGYIFFVVFVFAVIVSIFFVAIRFILDALFLKR